MLRQLVDLLDQLPPNVYNKSLELFSGSSIGQHVRHILDFYQCLFRGMPAGRIDYAQRDRDLQLERDPRSARDFFTGLLAQVEDIDEQLPLEVRADFVPDPQAPRPLVHSSVGRELMFAYDHAVHHLAIIKIGLKTCFPEIVLAEELGVAPSTLKYRKGAPQSGD